jgi:hypothetical protein
MKTWKRILVAIILAAILVPAGLSLTGCGHDHHRHYLTDVPAAR